MREVNERRDEIPPQDPGSMRNIAGTLCPTAILVKKRLFTDCLRHELSDNCQLKVDSVAVPLIFESHHESHLLSGVG